MKGKLSFLIVAVVVLLADQATKAWATAALKPVGSIEIIPGFFRLSYALNRGVAFSLFSESPFDLRWVLAGISAIAAILVFAYLLRAENPKAISGLSLALLLSGIAGNLLDRVRIGEVVDFLDFHLGSTFTWPTFNVADSAICIGAVLLAIHLMREERAERARSATQVVNQ